MCQRTLREYQERRFATRYAVACRSVGPGANNSVRGWATQGHLVRPKSVPCESVVWFGRCNLLSKGRDSGCASQSAFTGAGLAKRIVNEVDGDFAIADEGSEPLWWWWPDKASVPQSTNMGNFCTLCASLRICRWIVVTHIHNADQGLPFEYTPGRKKKLEANARAKRQFHRIAAATTRRFFTAMRRGGCAPRRKYAVVCNPAFHDRGNVTERTIRRPTGTQQHHEERSDLCSGAR